MSIFDWLLKVTGTEKYLDPHEFQHLATIFIGSSLVAFAAVVMFPFVKRFMGPGFKPKGEHCYVTGGSLGLGKAVAMDLARRGAHVTIVARTENKLKSAVEEIKACRVGEGQKINYLVVDVTDRPSAQNGIRQAAKLVGKPAKFVFNCAGQAMPGMFLEQELSEYEQGMKLNYFGALYTTHEAVKMMVDNGVKGGKVVFTASVLAFMSFAGYGQYSPAKFALRGLAETLRNELTAYDIDVHIYYPGTILSPGLETENARKPQITKTIEGSDAPLTPEQCSAAVMSGLDAGNFAITSDFVGHVLRSVSIGIDPTNNLVFDWIFSCLGWLIFGPWRMYADSLAKSEGGKKKK